MKHRFRNLVAGLGTAMLLAACGGGGGGGDAEPVTLPSAVAKASPATLDVGGTVVLDASASTSPRSGAQLQYQWSLAQAPDGSAAQITDAQGVRASFVPDRGGQYQVVLQVNDGTAVGSTQLTVVATNPNPEARITPATQSVLVGAMVSLDGSASLPPTGLDASGLTYEWTLIEQPEQEPHVILQDANSARATFLAEKQGVYKAVLRVSHGDRHAVPVETTILVGVTNSAPVIELTAPEQGIRGQRITLDASKSHDPDGETLRFRWRFPDFIANTSNKPIPNGSASVLENAHTAQASFVPDMAGNYVVDLTVYDGSVDVTQRVTIQVAPQEGDSNTPPVAKFEFDASECELGGPYPHYQVCLLSPIQSYDADGDKLSYKWRFWNAASPADIQEATSTGSLNKIPSTSAGTWHVELVANDGKTDGAPAFHTLTIKIGANTRPTVEAKVLGGINRVMKGTEVRLDGSGSKDNQNDQMHYAWTWLDRPTGSRAELVNANSVMASFTADVPGLYVARLVVTDYPGGLPSRTDVSGASVRVFAKETNNPPFLPLQAVLPGQPVMVGSPVSVDRFSLALKGNPQLKFYDTDMDTPLHALLTVTSAPAGSTAQDASATFTASPGLGVHPNLNALHDLPGDYTVEVSVSDGIDMTTTTHHFSAVACAAYPTLRLSRSKADAPEEDDPCHVYPFPFAVDPGKDGLGIAMIDGYYDAETSRNRVFHLTAHDQDYTITDLQTSSKDAAYQPTFQGLTNGQVIRKGETVTFRVIRPLIANEEAEAAELLRIRQEHHYTSELYKQAVAQAQGRMDALQFIWSFRVQEKDGYVFRIGR